MTAEAPYVVVSESACSACGGSTLVSLCGRTDDSHEPCVLRGGHIGPCYGEDDVASGWSPAASCRVCCVCPCGSTSDGTLCRFCKVVMRPGFQPPNFDPSTHRPRETSDETS